MVFNNLVRIFISACLLASAIAAHAATGLPKHMVFASDTQYPWTDKTDSREPESDSEFKERSKWLVESQLASIAEFRNQHGSQAQVPLMINGDITAFGHGWQRSYMKAALNKYFGGDYLYGLGNHDYEIMSMTVSVTAVQQAASSSSKNIMKVKSITSIWRLLAAF
jgi:hypothetical protein